MKKVLYLAGIIAVLAACNKDNKLEPQNTHFEKGEEVTIAVGVPGTSGKARRADGYTRGEDGNIGGIGDIDFQWNENDVITITVGSESSDFYLLKDRGGYGVEGSTKSEDLNFGGVAYFRGHMPGDGQNFTVTYGPKDVPSKQYYHYDGIGRGIMRFEATNCSLDKAIELQPKFAAIRTAVAADFTYSEETGASAWANIQGLEVHPMVGSLHIKAFQFENESGNPDFECDYIINKEVGGAIIGDKACLYVVFVLPPANYREIDITPKKEGTCYAEYNGEKVLEGTCENPVCHAIKSTTNICPTGFEFLEGEYTYLGAPIDIQYTYKALKTPAECGL
ncbi:MAG: lipoprotein [Paludibacteraceae bacterium]|nr:lipoprotein [Paludibacteraceae bacterium]